MRLPSRLWIWTAALVILLACPPLRVVAGGENPKQPSGDQELPQINVRRPPIHTAPIQVDVDMVLLNVTVTDEYEEL